MKVEDAAYVFGVNICSNLLVLGLVCRGRAMPACCEVMCRGETEGGVSCDSGKEQRVKKTRVGVGVFWKAP